MTSPSNGNDLTSDPEVSAVLTATKTLSHGLTQNPLHIFVKSACLAKLARRRTCNAKITSSNLVSGKFFYEYIFLYYHVLNT